MGPLPRRLLRSLGVLPLVGLLALVCAAGRADRVPTSPGDEYGRTIQPLLKQYCLTCHSTKLKKGSLDLERFVTLDQVRKDLKPWQQLIEMVEAGEMPPKNKPQPTADERRQLLAWTHGFLDAEARARAGDPGYVPLRRLSNAEYDCTIRDLTGVDLRPTREFPADGAAGEGFTNAAEALSDVSPALLAKYLRAAKQIAGHAVLLPDGFRFSPTATRRDWTDESMAHIRRFYADFTGDDGRLPLQPYLAATVRHRDALLSGKTSLDAVAEKEKLNRKYLVILWQTLTDTAPSQPLDRIRLHWRQASEKDVAGLMGESAAWQAVLWKFVPIGSYRYGNTIHQLPNDPAATGRQPLRLAFKPVPGQSEVTLYLTTRGSAEGQAIWQRPRFEGAGKPPLLLRDYAQYAAAYEIDFPTVFTDTPKYLAAARAAVEDRKGTVEDLAKKQNLDPAFLKRWLDVLDLEPADSRANADNPGKPIPLVPVELLTEKSRQNANRPAINGWHRPGAELPVLITNASDTVEHVPGKIEPHHVAVHPTPTEFVAVAWKSPAAGSVRVSAAVMHAHPACGNGVAWWLEHRRGSRAGLLAEGALDLGGAVKIPEKTLKVEKGDLLILAVDARNGDHACDLTEIALTVTDKEQSTRTWDLAADVADTVLDGNPHADRQGNKDVWSFVRGPSKPTNLIAGPLVPAGSVLDRWRKVALDPAQRTEAARLAEQARSLLCGARPPSEKDPNRLLYDHLVSVESPLLTGLDWKHFRKPAAYGLEAARFARSADGVSLTTGTNEVVAVRLPAALFRDRVFVAEGQLAPATQDQLVSFQARTTPPAADAPWDGTSPVVASPTGAAYKQLLQEYAAFRRGFPQFVCYPHIIPVDEVVCLKMFHREDEPLIQLFLDDAQTRRLNHLWEEHRFISQQPVAENNYLPQFIGFVTQDQPKELLAYFEGQRETFRKRAEEFEKDVEAAIPKQLDQLLDFAAHAYRRPLQEKEKSGLLALYRTLRQKGAAHDEAFRDVLARVLVSPAFLFRIETAPPGKEAAPVNDWELATRLSYFLWSSAPDPELRRLASEGRLHDPKVLAEQTQRLLHDGRARELAVEFGTQWIHVRGFDEFNEKNEKLFPTFDLALRQAMYEETIRFFQDLFQSDRPVTNLLDADYTFLNEILAKHYDIPGVKGPEWRRVDGVRKYGRGGILAMASVLSRQAGASRTSPVLRGNWLSETLLGEKLPRPPPNVPRLPEEEGTDRLTMRQQVERHARAPECYVCHQRIDPFGFSLERYDAIGRRRDRDLGGLAIDVHAKLKDGAEFDDLDGLRTYLLTKKKDVIVRLFCRRLLGYALGRAVTLSDQTLLDEMVRELDRNDGRVSAAVLTIVRSPQFRMIRGGEFASE